MSRIGYWLSEKKIKRLNFNEFVELCRNAGLELVQIDLSKSLESQGPFDAFLHKVTDLIAKAEQGNVKARQQISSLQEYLRGHPETVVVDPLENVYKLLDRHEQYKFVQDFTASIENSMVIIPSFVEFNSTDIEENKRLMEEYGVQYPFVCKPSVANGTSFCHKMQLIFNEDGLRDVEPPCVAQTFINHNAVLYKLFVIGELFFVVKRPSLKNFAAGPHKTIYFDSHDVSKSDSASYLNRIDEFEYTVIEPERPKLEHLVNGLYRHLGLSLFGADVIVENGTGRYCVIDINAFPSYDGVPKFNILLLQLLQDSLKKASLQGDQALLNNNQRDTRPKSDVHIHTGEIQPPKLFQCKRRDSFHYSTPTLNDVLNNSTSATKCCKQVNCKTCSIDVLTGKKDLKADVTPVTNTQTELTLKAIERKEKRLSKEERVLNELNEQPNPVCDTTNISVVISQNGDEKE